MVCQVVYVFASKPLVLTDHDNGAAQGVRRRVEPGECAKFVIPGRDVAVFRVVMVAGKDIFVNWAAAPLLQQRFIATVPPRCEVVSNCCHEVKTVPEPLQLVVFTLDEQRYALHLPAVERAIRMIEITPLPTAPEIVIGVVNVHGAVVPVLNIRKRFRLPEREPDLSDQLIIARTARRIVALVVDTINDVIALPSEELVAPETILPQLEHVEGVVKLDDGMIFIQDLDAFLSLEEEQALEAAIEEENS